MMKKLMGLIIVALILAFYCFPPMNSGLLANVNDLELIDRIINNGEYQILDKELPYTLLEACDNNQLSLIRNTIFARYGYRFKSIELQKHFVKFNWYKPKCDDVNLFLTAIDKINIKKILELEKRFKEVSDKDEESRRLEPKLIGLWHAGPMLAAGWDEKYLFYRNGLFRFDYADELKRIISFSGDWYVENNKLVVIKRSNIVIKGGTLEESPSGGYYVEGGTIIKEKVTPPQKVVYDLGAFEENHNYPHPKMVKIGGKQYWQFFNDPKEYETLYKSENDFYEDGILGSE